MRSKACTNPIFRRMNQAFRPACYPPGATLSTEKERKSPPHDGGGALRALLIILATFLPGWNDSTFLAGTKTSSLVLGLRALRAARRLISKTPKLRSSTLPLSATA